MASLTPLRDLRFQFAITAETTRSVPPFARALVVIEEFAELAESSPNPNDPDVQELRDACRIYATMCHYFIRQLTAKESAREHDIYRRASPRPQRDSEQGGESQHKRRGVVFNVDGGDHVIAALEALRLEEFLDEQERRGPKKVRFAN